MEIISYFNSSNKQTLIDLIEGCDWGAAKFLATLLKEDRFLRCWAVRATPTC